MRYKIIILIIIAILILIPAGFLFNEIRLNYVESFEKENLVKIRDIVNNFENLLKGGTGRENIEKLFSFFADGDNLYQDAVMSDIINKDGQFYFKVSSYKIISAVENKDENNYQVIVQENRDYSGKNNVYGTDFLRVFIVENMADGWKIKEYKKNNNGNFYSGNLSGDKKFDGFYY